MTPELSVLIDPSLNVDPADLKASWDRDPDASRLGRLEVRPSGRQFTGFLELVVLPVAVAVATDLIKEAVKRLLGTKTKEELIVVVQSLPDGSQAVVVQKQ
jgi:hypothetical protein